MVIHGSSAVAVHVHALVTVARKPPPARGALWAVGMIVRSHAADEGGTPILPSHAAISDSRPARRAPAERRFIRRSNTRGALGENRLLWRSTSRRDGSNSRKRWRVRRLTSV